ncbi:hypothetical protein VKT23_018606 [Stygiomarasmius scandens]|uniref:Fungal lipase-type domain-containing protein n=1 Tax=Marasmiellus scandens TaxID=2682957 RepID=A0ABR1IRK5_9AGAR
MRTSYILLSTLLGVTGIYAAPAPKKLEARQDFSILSDAAISAFSPYSRFAAAAYCSADSTLQWNCGENCDANSDFVPVASGGNGDSVQFWYVGFSPSLATVIVAHQGTDPTQLESVLTDADFPQDTLDTSLFPGVSSDIKVHGGFADAHAETATDVLAAVQTALANNNVNSVTIVGHSLGGALAVLESIYLPLHISGPTFKTVTYGTPRIGNAAFADYVDAHTDLTRVNNKEDLIPIVPGRGLGFAHPNGEVRIQDNDQWITCPGHDNTDERCTTGAVGNIFEGNIIDHLGPYNGITIASFGCA